MAWRTRSLQCALRLDSYVLQRASVRSFTSWWHRWVDGVNPENASNAEVSDMLRIAGIDPCAAIRAVAVDL
ncbi:unnamed protein product [Durusdinium trenchii]|uniref:Uncharacterized protein n=1 Tax=Durusdinium trenchii TaxID=1381693 RepID=A0ABP0M360_9DINO|eukprot:g24849.t1